MKSVKYCQRHGDVCDNSPRPNTEQLQMFRSELSAILFQRVDNPRCHVRYEEESDHGTTGFLRPL